MKKALIIGGIVLTIAVALAALWFFVVEPRRQASIQAAAVPTTATVTRGSIEQTVSATGNVAAESQVTLSFDTSGRIEQVLGREGQSVKAGDVLARLDTSSLEWQVTRAQASLQTAQARLRQAQQAASAEDLASAQAALDSSRASYERVKAGPSREDLASAQAALDSAKSSYDKVKAGPTTAELASAKAALDSAEAVLVQRQQAYDRVKGQPNIGLLPQSVELQNATIEYQRAKANFEAAANHPTASELAAARQQVAQAEAQFAKLKEQPTASDLAAAQAQVAQAEAQVAQLQARPNADDVAVAQAGVDEAQVALEQAQSQLDSAVLKAPFEGTVVTAGVEEGEWMSPGSPAFVLAKTEPLYVDVQVDEVDVAQLVEGQAAHLRFSALKGQVVDGVLARIAPAATTVSGAQAYDARIAFDKGDLPARLGMTSEVQIVVGRADDALLVPNRAITADREAGRYFVTLLRPGGATEKVEVRIGLRDGQSTQIVAGLEESDRVVLPEVQVPQQDQNFGPFGGEGPPGMGGGQP
jgi:HlyD family secretion protein